MSFPKELTEPSGVETGPMVRGESKLAAELAREEIEGGLDSLSNTELGSGVTECGEPEKDKN